MSVSGGEVVGQIRAVIESIDRTAVAATDAQTDARQANVVYLRAKLDTKHPDLNNAVAKSGEAADKAGKIARLLAAASDHFANYLNIIAPGSVEPSSRTRAGMPAGEELTESGRERPRNISDALLARTASTRNSDDGLEGAKTALNTLIDAARVRDTGAMTEYRPPEATLRAAPGPDASGGDFALGTLILALLALRGGEMAAEQWRNVSAKVRSARARRERSKDGN